MASWRRQLLEPEHLAATGDEWDRTARCRGYTDMGDMLARLIEACLTEAGRPVPPAAVSEG